MVLPSNNVFIAGCQPRAEDSPRDQEDGHQQVDLVGLEEPRPVPVRDAVVLAAVVHGKMDPDHGRGESQEGGEQPDQDRHLLGLGGGAEVLGPHGVNHSVVSGQEITQGTVLLCYCATVLLQIISLDYRKHLWT